MTGNDLYGLCGDGEQGRPGDMCVGYIVGVYQTAVFLQATKHLCPGPDVSNEQIVDVVVRSLRDHPEMRDEQATLLILAAIQKTWPC